MDNQTIFTKTGKGLQEATGRTSGLSREMRNILKEVDGKADVAQLAEKLPKIPEKRLFEALETMERDGYVREFVRPTSTAQPVQRHTPPSKSPTADLGEDLDFTSVPSGAGGSDSASGRQVADERARQAAAARAREEAEAKSRAEAAAMAKAQAEAKAKAEAAAKARAAAEAAAKAKAEAEAKAKAEAAAKAKAEADARAKREAEEKARREADELRSQLEAERKAREETERRAQEQAERRAREAADEARKETEALRVQLEQERAAREQEERKRKEEGERKAREEAEARARREAEERKRKEEGERKAREEAEARARREEEDRKRKEEEERKAREDEERKRREEQERKAREDEDRKRKEEEERKAREEAEARARREEEDRKRKEEEERKAREDEERKRREEQERKAREDEERKRKEEDERKAREEEERKREEEEELREREEAEAAAEESKTRDKEGARAAEQARKEARARERTLARERKKAGIEAPPYAADVEPYTERPAGEPRPPRNWARTITLGFFVILVAAVGVVYVVPIDVAPYEKAAQERFGEKVRIGSIQIRPLPAPYLSMEKVSIGEAGAERRLQIASVKAVPEFGSIFGARKVFKSVEMAGISLPQGMVGGALWGKGRDDALRIERVVIKGLKLDLKGMVVPPLDVDASFGTSGLEKARLVNDEKGVSVSLKANGAQTDIEIEAKTLELPFAQNIALNDFLAKGALDAQQLTLREFEARAFDGIFAGSARVSWRGAWDFSGAFEARAMDAAKLAGPIVSTGTLEGKGVYSMKSDLPEKLVASARIEGTFKVTKGSIAGVDLTQMLRGARVTGGSSLFSEMTGTAVAEPRGIQLRQIRFSAGLLSAGGSVDLDPQQNLSGRLEVELRSQARATVAISGTLAKPVFRR